MKKIKNCPPSIRDGIQIFTQYKASLYGNIAKRGVIRIISRKAISPLDSTSLTTENRSDSLRRKNIRTLSAETFNRLFYRSFTEKTAAGYVSFPDILFSVAVAKQQRLKSIIP